MTVKENDGDCFLSSLHLDVCYHERGSITVPSKELFITFIYQPYSVTNQDPKAVFCIRLELSRYGIEASEKDNKSLSKQVHI